MSKHKGPVDPESLPYRPCVGLMVLNRVGLVWAGRRIVIPGDEMDGATQLWQMPQGGIDKGEDPIEAAIRELYEETGMKSVSLLAEAPNWINYDLPPHLVGQALRASIAARRRNGLPIGSRATRARSPSIRRPAGIRPSSIAGSGSRCRNCRN